jgi:hypothetical protein
MEARSTGKHVTMRSHDPQNDSNRRVPPFGHAAGALPPLAQGRLALIHIIDLGGRNGVAPDRGWHIGRRAGLVSVPSIGMPYGEAFVPETTEREVLSC